MRTKNLFLLAALIAGLGLIAASRVTAQTFTNLHNFTGFSDGADPYAGLILSGNTLYGTVAYGGGPDNGTVFKVNTDGTGFTNLHNFAGGPSDGAAPTAGLILLGNTLYGTTYGGGSSDRGTVFKVNTDGTGFTILYSFTATPAPLFTNNDGAYPYAGLILLGNTLYGTALSGGSSRNGTVFAVNTDGMGFTNLYSFTGDSDGAAPHALILSSNTLYGTAFGGGSSGNGTVFRLSLGSVSAPQLTIIGSGADVILTWPTNATGFTLQSTTNLLSAAVWITVSPGPVVVNEQNTVTNPISGIQQFFRLSQ